MPRSYRTLYPIAKRDNYIANDVVDFELTSENNSIRAGSIYLSGKVQLRTAVGTYNETVAGTLLDADSDVKLDPYAGAHSFFRRINCETSQGTLENLDNYPRLVRMVAEGNMYKDDMSNETDKQMALQSGQDQFGKAQILPLGTVNTDDATQSFCIRPLIAFNSSSADIPYRRSGLMRISLRMAPLAEVAFGSDWASTCGYWVSDLQLHYEVVPDDGSNGPILFQIYQHIPHVINSPNASVSSLMAGLSNAMSASFLKGDLEDSSYANNLLQTSVLPDVTRVLFAFNDSDNVRIAYPIESNEELELNYQRSLGKDGPNSLLLSKQHRNKAYSEGYGIGVAFGTLKNLTNSKFDLTIQAGSDGPSSGSANRYRAFLYFRGLVQM